MIAALWHRWFDSREHRRAREVAEQNYSQALIRVADLGRQLSEVRLEHGAAVRRLDETAADRDAIAGALDGHNDRLYEALANARAAHRDALDTITTMRRQIEDLTRQHDPVAAQKIADQYAQVSKLPPSPNRDRANAVRLSGQNSALRAEAERLRAANGRLEDEVAQSREWIEKCRREHR